MRLYSFFSKGVSWVPRPGLQRQSLESETLFEQTFKFEVGMSEDDGHRRLLGL